MLDLLAHYVGLSLDDMEYLFSLSPRAMYEDPVYQSLIAQLDVEMLRDTLDDVQNLYNTYIERIKEAHNLSHTVMSGHTLSRWIVAYLVHPERMEEILDHHALLPTQKIAETLPSLIDVLGRLEDGGQEWQRALVIMSLPLLARG
jgi:hypothetical protein